MRCKVCGKEFFPYDGYQKMGQLCSVNCYQDLYNEPDIDKPDREENEETEDDGEDE